MITGIHELNSWELTFSRDSSLTGTIPNKNFSNYLIIMMIAYLEGCEAGAVLRVGPVMVADRRSELLERIATKQLVQTTSSFDLMIQIVPIFT